MSSASSPLQSSSTVEEFIAALHQVVANNDSLLRSEESVSIILNSKIQLIFNNCTNQDLLQALGEFFMWMMPYTESLSGAEREAEAEERERGREICARKEIEDLFVNHLLPCAESSDAIYSLCRSVGRIALKTDNTYFVTADARDELLKLVNIAQCEKSFQCALQAICNLAYSEKHGVPIESNPFLCDEVCAIAHESFCESAAPKIVEVAADILIILVAHSNPQFYSTDSDFAHKMLLKLDDASETETISSIANLIDIILRKKQCSMQLFASDEAARVVLSKLNSSVDVEVLRLVCLCFSNVVERFENISEDFASPEMCRAIFKSFSKQKDEPASGDVMCLIATLTGKLPRARSTFAQECPDLAQAITATLTTATHDNTRRNVAIAVANISMDAESAKRLFNNISLYDALIRSSAQVHDANANEVFITAMHNATSVCTDFLPYCAARYPFYDERQIELLNADSLDSLVSTLENREWVFHAPANADFLKLRSILIVLEKFDQFLEVLDQRIEKGDARIEEMLLTIARGFSFMVRTIWVGVFGDPFVDVTLSLLERSSGAANAVFANVIFSIVMNNPLLTVYPSTVLRLLQKLDNSKELRDRESGGVKMELDIYKVVEEAGVRNPELYRDNNFLVDNSALIKSCFERSFEIHEFDAMDHEKLLLASYLGAVCKADPRMKQKMDGWDHPVAKVA